MPAASWTAITNELEYGNEPPEVLAHRGLQRVAVTVLGDAVTGRFARVGVGEVGALLSPQAVAVRMQTTINSRFTMGLLR
jgi:hypothetical protein